MDRRLLSNAMNRLAAVLCDCCMAHLLYPYGEADAASAGSCELLAASAGIGLCVTDANIGLALDGTGLILNGCLLELLPLRTGLECLGLGTGGFCQSLLLLGGSLRLLLRLSLGGCGCLSLCGGCLVGGCLLTGQVDLGTLHSG